MNGLKKSLGGTTKVSSSFAGSNAKTAAINPAGRLLWMRRFIATLGLCGIAIVVLVAFNPFRVPAKEVVNGYRVVAEYPHDTAAFTQGLVFVDDRFYEGTGKQGQSSIRRVEPNSGRIEQIVQLDSDYFGEGITILDGKIYQLTWQNRIGIIYDKQTLAKLSTFRYSGEGWGLTHNGKQLILSDGTPTLRFLDPKTFEVTKRIVVKSGRQTIKKLNELEYVKGEILANIWYQDRIARISPESGDVLGWIDLTSLYPASSRPTNEDVLNGIAYDETQNRLFVTGKNWPRVFEIEIVEK